MTTNALRRLLVLLLLGAATGVVVLHLVNPGRAARLEMLERHHQRLGTMMTRIDRDNQALAAELDGMERGLETWRSVARREYGMISDGEVVFRFPKRAPPR